MVTQFPKNVGASEKTNEINLVLYYATSVSDLK